MFNSKRIIFLIGLLSIVALTGALMAGPAFANPGHGKGGANATETSKVAMCHFEPEYYDAELEITVLDEWAMISVDEMSVPDHLAHDGDFVIDEDVDDNTTADCEFLVASTKADEGEE